MNSDDFLAAAFDDASAERWANILAGLDEDTYQAMMREPLITTPPPTLAELAAGLGIDTERQAALVADRLSVVYDRWEARIKQRARELRVKQDRA